MTILDIEAEEVDRVFKNLEKYKIIYHPKISIEGYPALAPFSNKKMILILDRNLLVRILRIVENGTLKNSYDLQLVGSLMFWCALYKVNVTSGLALMEYSYHDNKSLEAEKEHNKFQSIWHNYPAMLWYDLAIGKRKYIPKISTKFNDETNYNVESQHYLLNYIQVLKIFQLQLSSDVSAEVKFEIFYNWSYDNVLIGMYSNSMAQLYFSNRIKDSEITNNNSARKVLQKCKNIAWDLTYLSTWSTLYWNETKSNRIFLFGTMDKDLQKVFKLANAGKLNHYIKTFGKKLGTKYFNLLTCLYKPRIKPNFKTDELKRLSLQEEKELSYSLNKKYAI